MPRCPFCYNIVEYNSETCVHCGENLKTKCPYCAEYINVYDTKCPHCSMKLKSNSVQLLTNFSYISLFINALIPYWLSNSISEHPVFWSELISKKEDFKDFAFCFVFLFIISVIPAIVAFVNKYRRRLFVFYIIILFILCTFNIILLSQILK